MHVGVSVDTVMGLIVAEVEAVTEGRFVSVVTGMSAAPAEEPSFLAHSKRYLSSDSLLSAKTGLKLTPALATGLLTAFIMMGFYNVGIKALMNTQTNPDFEMEPPPVGKEN